jgi:hypothetical protein
VNERAAMAPEMAIRLEKGVGGNGRYLAADAGVLWPGPDKAPRRPYPGAVLLAGLREDRLRGVAAREQSNTRTELSTAGVELAAIHECDVARLVDFGVLLTILPGADGLAPGLISDLLISCADQSYRLTE